MTPTIKFIPTGVLFENVNFEAEGIKIFVGHGDKMTVMFHQCNFHWSTFVDADGKPILNPTSTPHDFWTLLHSGLFNGVDADFPEDSPVFED